MAVSNLPTIKEIEHPLLALLSEGHWLTIPSL